MCEETKKIRVEKVFRDGSEAVARVSCDGDTADLRFGYIVEGGCVHCFITEQADEALWRLLPGRPESDIDNVLGKISCDRRVEEIVADAYRDDHPCMHGVQRCISLIADMVKQACDCGKDDCCDGLAERWVQTIRSLDSVPTNCGCCDEAVALEDACYLGLTQLREIVDETLSRRFKAEAERN